MQTNIPCSCGEGDPEGCTGMLSTIEIKMAEMDPRRTAQEYHSMLVLFENAFDLDFGERE